MRWLKVSATFLAIFMFTSAFFGFDVSSNEQKQVNTELGASVIYTFAYKSEGRRDPFVPLITKKEAKEVELRKEGLETEETGWVVSEYELIGLVWDAKESFAIIQKKDEKWIVKRGDVINNFQVISIEGKKGEVILEQGRRLIKLRIRGQV
jgi:Tfp pilus assembly protein PilP